MLSRTRRLWPWALLTLATLPAIAHLLTFEHDLDGEYPEVLRPTFSPRPPAAYRLAEPGDTIDRVALYASAAGAVLAACGAISAGRAKLWVPASAACLAVGWFAVTPGPCYDGWYGWNWFAIGDSHAPIEVRLGLVAAGSILLAIILGGIFARRKHLLDDWKASRDRGSLPLMILAGILVVLRGFDIPGFEPKGYLPRWSLVWGMLAFDFAMLKHYPVPPRGWRRVAIDVGSVAATWGLIVGGIDVTWYHRPLERLRAVVPGGIYISAMPTYRGLAIEQERLHFKTIINLFPEGSIRDNRSHNLPDEARFVREHGIRYFQSPSRADYSDTFLDETLKLAKDPSAWPILVHCHGCMDRSPAWMGIYRFEVQGVPLDAIFREIEAHRGCRPKATVTMLYNRVLPERASKHYAEDPTAPILRACAAGVEDPYVLLQKKRVASSESPSQSSGVRQ